MAVRGKIPPVFIFDPRMTEDEWTGHILREAQQAGCWGHHVRDSRLNAGDKGAPDWLFLRPDDPADSNSPVALIWMELKNEQYQASADQKRVLQMASRIERVYTGLYRPRHWSLVQHLFRHGRLPEE